MRHEAPARIGEAASAIGGASPPGLRGIAPAVVWFGILVLVPVALAAWYLHARAADQYATTIAFAVEASEQPNPLSMFGEIGGFGGGRDAEIIVAYLRSDAIASSIDAELDLRRRYSRPARDPVFALQPDASTEDLGAFWRRMVRPTGDRAGGLVTVEVRAFTPTDAEQIARAILVHSSAMINGLRREALSDAAREAQEALDRAEARLAAARRALTRFRAEHLMVDPTADIAGRIEILNSLQGGLVEALIEQDLLRATTRADDPRLEAAERRIRVIEQRIAETRSRFGAGDTAFSSLTEGFERLLVEREFAEQSYIAALAAVERARAEASRQSLYLQPFVEPMVPEEPLYPERERLLLLVLLGCSVTWGCVSLLLAGLRGRF
ncbi:MAG: hypothetical protein ACPGID_02955 [Rubricella sp.]